MSYNNWTAAGSFYHLPVDGTKQIMAAGKLYAAPSSYGKNNSRILAEPGVLIIADELRQNSLGPSPSPTTNPVIYFGVGIDINKNGISDYIRWSSPITPDSLESYDTQDSDCGQSAIVDIDFDCVVRDGRGYTIEIVVKNVESDSFGRQNQGWRYTFTYTPKLDDCAECDDTISCDEIMCGLYNRIHKLDAPGEWNVRLNGEPVDADHNFPFTVAKLYDGETGSENTTGEWKIAPDTTDDGCVACLNGQAIGGININNTETTFDPGFTTTVGGNTYTKLALLKAVAEEITVALDGAGKAVAVPCSGACCEVKLEINSCYEVDTTPGAGKIVLLDDQKAAIAATSKSNPFSDVPVYQECKDCDNSATTKKYTCGLRVFGLPVEVECDCIVGNNTPREVSTDIEVYYPGGFSELGGAHVIRRQEPTEPKGQGYKWQISERQNLKTHIGEIVYHRLRGGMEMVPVGKDKLRLIQTRCDTSYCVLSLKWSFRGHEEPNLGRDRRPKSIGYLLVEGDPTTLATELKAMFPNYFDQGAAYFPEVCGI